MDDAKAAEQALIDDESVSNTKKMKAKIKLAGLESKGKKLKNMFFYFQKLKWVTIVSLCITMCHYIGCNLLLYKVNVSFLLQVDITFSQQISIQ